ncbi:MAG: hypothetical protein ACFFDS_00295 [Candidatus Thorarchaeota archaeon]
MVKKKLSKIISKKSNVKRFISLLVVFIIIIVIITIFSTTFFSYPREGFSEIALLQYNQVESVYETAKQPYFLHRHINFTIYFMIKNFENKITYYQLQIKITKLSQAVKPESPLATTDCYLMYLNHTYEKILFPATKQEKQEINVFTGNYIWSPTNVTLYFSDQFDSLLSGEGGVKIVFEIWKFNTQLEDFLYSGIFTFLELYVIG